MSQRSVEIIIGRLVTDEEFRRRFVDDPARMFDELNAAGVELTAAEVTALLSTERAAWDRMADALDPRLQKASLKPGAPGIAQ